MKGDNNYRNELLQKHVAINNNNKVAKRCPLNVLQKYSLKKYL